uniref:deoxyhypusine monooxygenase n=1 Tax=Lynx canadensis TaxID=61383 RepID=A0A667FWK8_LYNCA
MVTEQEVEEVGRTLVDPQQPLQARFRALFTLRGLGGPGAIAWIIRAFGDDSALLKHELAYCLGQMRDSRAIPVLLDVLRDTRQEPMVRHEAGEALGAIGNPEVLEVLKQYSADPVIEVAETCQLAVRRLEWLQQHSGEPAVAGPYLSVDPAPPAEERDVGRLREVLLDEGQPLFDRYPRLHAGRGGSQRAGTLGLRCGGASSATRSAMSLASGSTMAAVPQLAADPGPAQPRSPMGGSECAEDLGAIARPRLPLAALRGPLGPTPTPWCGESCEVPWTCTTTETGPAFQYRGRGWEQLRNGPPPPPGSNAY